MEESTRTCRTCRQDKPEDEFYWHDKAHTKRSTECKECVKARTASRWRRLHPFVEKVPSESSGEVRICIHCRETQPEENFYLKPSTGRRGNVCDSCRAQGQRSYHLNGPATGRRYRKYDRPDGRRQCRICDEVKPMDQFDVRDRTRGTHRTECMPCRKAIGKKRYAENPERHRETMRRSNFGLQPGQYDAMLLAQGGVCAICGGTETGVHHRSGKPRGLFVDHCHRTGAVRQLLCQHCNFGLGNFRDNPELMERAASYIRRFAA